MNHKLAEDIAYKALNIYWWQTETAARRVAEYAASRIEELEAKLAQRDAPVREHQGAKLQPWTKINKGDRRPTGRVLVRYEYEDFWLGKKTWGITGAWWNPKLQRWTADYGKPIGNVTHWTPMPGEEQLKGQNDD